MTAGSEFRTENGFRNRWMEALLYLTTQVKVPSKELAEPGPITLYDSQMRFLHEVDDGLMEGQNFFTVLKGRQLGISTLMLLIDILWLWMHPGLQGAVIADTDENTQTFRETITMMLETMPKGFRIPIERHNNKALRLKNGSRLMYLTAGHRKNPNLGRSKGLSFVHASEVSTYGDPDGLKSLIDAMSTENPHRFYVFESTAAGFNLFYDMVLDAKNDPTKRSIFIGWWAKSTYRIPRRMTINGQDVGPHPKFVQYWEQQPTLTDKERAMAFLMKKDYGVELSPEQWAWWRDQLSSRTETNLLQEHPWHEEVAFQYTGHKFFKAEKLAADMSVIRSGAVSFSGYRYVVDNSFLNLRCEPVGTIAEADLRIWEPPIKGARYAMGVDVAYGRNPNNDRHAINIWRCYADKLVQVAEWATNIPETRVVAWALAHLAGSYQDIMINLEVTGPGLQVMDEVNRLRTEINYAALKYYEPTIGADGRPAFDHKYALDRARWFLYHRPDTPSGGYMHGWKSNSDNKQHMMNNMRDSYSNDQLLVRSAPLIEEMGDIIQNGVQIGARVGKKDDRVISAGLACQAWREWIRTPMMHDRRTYEVETRRQQMAIAAGGKVEHTIVAQHFTRMAKERREAALQSLLYRR